jgi:hypothetical protein
MVRTEREAVPNIAGGIRLVKYRVRRRRGGLTRQPPHLIKVVEEAGVFAGDVTSWGCHSVVRMLVLLYDLGFINGCFL